MTAAADLAPETVDPAAIVASWGAPPTLAMPKHKPAAANAPAAVLACPAPAIATPKQPTADDAKILAGMSKRRPSSPADDLPVSDGADFCRDLQDYDEVVDNVVVRGMVYGCTGLTGHGKTAALKRLAISVAVRQAFGPHSVQQGRVLYLAGENPDDVRMRTLATLQEMGLSPDVLRGNYFVIPAAFPLVSRLAALHELADRIGPLAVVFVDTSAAFFSYGDEIDNVDARNHAADCRSLTTLNGNPAVIVACHPTKNAGKENLIPRGGGGFLNEIDGNLTIWRDGEVVTLHHNKLRGAPFDPIQFRLKPVELDGITRRNGKPVRSVAAEWINDVEAGKLEKTRLEDENRVLWAMLHHASGSMADWASACGWKGKGKVSRALDSLATDHLVKKYRGKYTLTDTGKREAERIRE